MRHHERNDPTGKGNRSAENHADTDEKTTTAYGVPRPDHPDNELIDPLLGPVADKMTKAVEATERGPLGDVNKDGWTLIVVNPKSRDFEDFTMLNQVTDVLNTYNAGGTHLVSLSDEVGALLGPLSVGPARVFDTTGRLLTAYPHISKITAEDARRLLT